jgi:large subunit ribosomal protein L30
MASKKIVVQLYASPIRRNSVQKLYLKSLGLRKVNSTRELTDSPSVQGLLRKIPHLVRVVG